MVVVVMMIVTHCLHFYWFYNDAMFILRKWVFSLIVCTFDPQICRKHDNNTTIIPTNQSCSLLEQYNQLVQSAPKHSTPRRAFNHWQAKFLVGWTFCWALSIGWTLTSLKTIDLSLTGSVGWLWMMWSLSLSLSMRNGWRVLHEAPTWLTTTDLPTPV